MTKKILTRLAIWCLSPSCPCFRPDPLPSHLLRFKVGIAVLGLQVLLDNLSSLSNKVLLPWRLGRAARRKWFRTHSKGP